MKSKLLVNKVLIVVCSTLIVLCIGVMAFFFINHNKTIKEKENSSEANTKVSNESVDEKSSEGKQQNDENGNDGIVLTEDYSSWNEKCSPELVVVNSNNKMPESYKVEPADYCGVKINSIISEPLNKMIETARLECGANLWLSSSYRDIETQKILFQREVKSKLAQGYPQQKAESLAAEEVARPGYSEHNTGLAVDFNGVSNDFKGTKEYEWLLANSYKFGFILRYPEEKRNLTGIVYEPWHFRFVGVDVATKMKNENICLEEYVLSVK